MISRLLASIASAHAFYLPGVAPKQYFIGDPVDLKVDKLTSTAALLPHDYYKLPFCRPDVIVQSTENLGEILTGELIQSSSFKLNMQQNKSCVVQCSSKLTQEDKTNFIQMIDDEYQVHMIMDNLPSITQYVGLNDDVQSNNVVVLPGHPIGMVDEATKKHIVYNHLQIVVFYHDQPNEFKGSRIVGFETSPWSFAGNEKCGMKKTPTAPNVMIEDVDEITFTYEVMYLHSPIRWASRWDHYLKMDNGNVHWFAIVNSMLVALFLSAMLAVILLRTVRRDIAKYGELESLELAEETGWKLVHGDVFRKPGYSRMLAMCVGSGGQLLVMSFITVLFAGLGFLSPAHRGSLLQSALLLFAMAGIVGGYTAVRFYLLFDGDAWKMTTLLTAFLFPGVCFSVFFLLNLFVWHQGSTQAVPFMTLVTLLFMWFGLSVPLTFIGASIARRRKPIELPVRTNQIPRQIPKQPWYMSTTFTCVFGGVLPFGAVFTEFFFIMNSIWQHRFYYLFGFVMCVLVLLVMTCAQISIALTYFQLSTENHRWWWRAFLSSGSCAFYMMAYSFIFFFQRLHIHDVIPTIIYFGYMSLFAYAMFLLCGAVGVLASFRFVKIIYGSVKVD